MCGCIKVRVTWTAVGLALLLNGCGDEAVQGGSDFVESIERMAEELRDASPMMRRAFELAVVRLAVEPVKVEERDGFPPDAEIALANSRPELPAPGTAEFARALSGVADRLAGLSPETIVAIHVSAEAARLDRQEAWARRWQRRFEIDRRRESSELARRRRLLERFSPREPRYSWVEGRPWLRLRMFNAIELPITRVVLGVDLFTERGALLATGEVDHTFRTPLARGSEATVSIDLSGAKPFDDRRFEAVVGEVSAEVVLMDVWADGVSMMREENAQGLEVEVRARRISSLLERIGEERANLARFRAVLADRMLVRDGSR